MYVGLSVITDTTVRKMPVPNKRSGRMVRRSKYLCVSQKCNLGLTIFSLNTVLNVYERGKYSNFQRHGHTDDSS
jgi:hypothetical protein